MRPLPHLFEPEATRASFQRTSPTLGTWLRTLAPLHPAQLLTRVPHKLGQRVLKSSGLSTWGAPALRPLALETLHTEALGAFAEGERERYLRRLPFLASNPALEAYESRYGLELGDPRHMRPARGWADPASLPPYVASVRARRLATACALGRTELREELARGARAVLLAPELHLLGNHLLENGLGLAAAGAASSGPEADLWWRAGEALLSWQWPRQALSDGMHDEGSMSYHLALVAGLLEVLALARASGRTLPSTWSQWALAGLALAQDYEAPDGTYPLFNDADADAAPSIDAVRRLAAGLGYRPRAPRTEPVFVSDVGWVVLRHPRAWCVMKAGPDGSPTQPGHVHADMLGIELWVDGVKRIRDPGVSSYRDDEERAWCRGGAAHNGPRIDGQDSSEVWGAFRTGRRCQGTAHLETAVGSPLRASGEYTRGGGRARRTLELWYDRLVVLDETQSRPNHSPHVERHEIAFDD